jgi:hypothetical protein
VSIKIRLNGVFIILSKSFSFYFSVYKDEIYTVRLSHQLNRFFPKVEVIAIDDGPYDEHSLKVAENFNLYLKVIKGERLKSKLTGGCEFTQRNFEVLLVESDSDIFIKLDPDSYINHSFDIPDDDWFGHVHFAGVPYLGYHFNFIAGGAMGLSRNAVEKIVESKLLLDKKYDQQGGFYDRYKRYKKFGDPLNESDLIRREDWVLGDVCRRLNIKPSSWPDVYCVQDVEVDDDSFAIIHPVKHRW